MAIESRQQQPSVATVQTHTIPQEMKEAARWVVWRYEPNKDKPGWTKVPYNARTSRRASSTGPSTWSVFQAAVDAYKHRGYDGIGFVSGDGWTLVDLDHAIDGETGDPKLWARHIIDNTDSYAELSPSGTGIRIVTHANCPGEEKRTDYRDGRVEIYAAGQYLTITGHHLAGTPATVEERSEQIADVHRHVFADRKAKAGVHKARSSQASVAGSSMNDLDLIEFGKRQKDGGKFARLWDGDTSGYPSHSEADQALVNKLVFLGIEDPERIDAAFRESGLMREKWERDDYRAQTIEKALLAVSDRYQPGAKGTSNEVQVELAPAQADSGAKANIRSSDLLLEKENARLQNIIAKQADVIAKQGAEIRELKQQLSWELRMQRNKTFTPNERVIASAIRQDYLQAKASGKKEFMVYYPAVGEKIGLSDKTVRSAVERFEKSGYMTRTEVKHVSQAGPRKGQEVDRVVLDLGNKLLEHPELLKRDEKRKQGGATRCPQCGKRHLLMKTHYRCLSCGETWESEPRLLHEQDEPSPAEEKISEIAAPSSCDTEYSENFSTPPELVMPETVKPEATFIPQQHRQLEPCYRCHQTAWSWRGDRLECDICHPACPSQRQEAG